MLFFEGGLFVFGTLQLQNGWAEHRRFVKSLSHRRRNMVFPSEQNFLIEMKQTLFSLALILFGLGTGYGQTTLDLELNGISTDLDPFMFEVQLAFDVLPDSMGTGNEMGSGWQQYEPSYTFTMFPVGTLTTEYYWEESIANLSMYVAVICGEDTTMLPPIDFESNTPTNITYAVSVDVGCGDGDVEWDCPEYMSNFGWGCQDGWGIIDENCDCIEYIEPENCLEGFLPGTDSISFDPSSLLMYALLECGNQDNLEPWVFCGLAESISAAMAGDEEACNEVWGWIEANDWDGSWDPGNGGGNNDFDCPELFGNIGEPCGINQGTFGVINEDCECIQVPDCDLMVETNLLSIDDGTGSGSVEAIASGGTPPYVYIWTDFWDEQLLIEVDTLGGTGTTLDSVPAGTYFLQVTDANGCLAFGWEDVPMAWDCPELEANVGDFCGNGNMVQVVSEDCECVDDVEPNACVADFTVVQAYNENQLIPFELFVFVWGYDESNSYSWDFGDEGSSSDPFPTWTYGGNGPYNLCLTVSNEEEDCVSTSCQMLEIDSLGWSNGFMNGFSITVLNGEPDDVNGVDEHRADEFRFSIFPNPSVNGSFGVNWETSGAGLVDITMLSLDGSVVLQTTRSRAETGNAQSFNVEHLAPGLYLCRIRQNGFTRTEKVMLRHM
jgi:hypothetical protein